MNKGDLRFREYDEYRGYYCGLCQTLKKRFGLAGQLSLSYDMTFLVMLLTSLYEPLDNREMKRCIAHPLKKQYCKSNEYTEYVADMTVLLSYYKCQDDWEDEKKLLQKVYGDILRSKSKKQRESYKRKEEIVIENLKNLSLAEKNKEDDLDVVAGCFGNILAELFVVKEDEWSDNLRKIGYYLGKYIYIMDAYDDLDVVAGYFGNILSELFVVQEDEWSDNLRKIGYYLGKYIYIMDAYDDLETDLKKGNYNPFAEKMCNTGNFDFLVKEILTIMAAECAKEFEKLPLLNDVDILRNILYSGIWTKYEMVKVKRSK